MPSSTALATKSRSSPASVPLVGAAAAVNAMAMRAVEREILRNFCLVIVLVGMNR